MSKPIAQITNFNKGIVTDYGRGKEPDGSFADSKNLVPTRQGSLETAHGYSTTGGLASLPTGFRIPTAGSTSDFNIANLLAKPFPFSSETPIAYDGKVWFFQDNQGSPVKHVALDSWFNRAATLVVSPNSGFVVLDERKIFAGTDVTVSASDPTYTIVVSDASTTHGLSETNDYYIGWRIEWYDDNIGTTEYAYVTDYAFSTGTATFTVKENLAEASGTWHLIWNNVAAGDTFTVRRWFHRPDNMVVDFNTPPGECFEANGRVRGSGGASSDEDKFPWISQYINRGFLTGHASVETYQGTYVDQMECSPYARQTEDSNGRVVEYNTTGSDSAKQLAAGTYTFGWTLEYDGYQESRLVKANGAAASGTNDYFTYFVAFKFAKLNKRVTAINVYASQTISGVESQYYFIRRHDIVNPTTAELTQWFWEDDGVSIIKSGEFFLVGTQAELTGQDWISKGGTYFQRTGRIEEGTSDRNIVAWKNAEIVASTLFVANFYDPNEADTFVDQVRHTGFDINGVPNYDVLSWDRGAFEFDVASGDPASIKKLVGDQNWLNIFKDSSIFSFFIDANPETWTPFVVSRRDGLYAVESIVKVPEHGIIFADTDHLKLLRNQSVIPLTANIETSYYALTKANIVAWYDKIDRSIRFSDLAVASSLYTVWVGYLDLGYFREDGRFTVPFYKCLVPDKPSFVSTERDESVLLANGTATAVYKWHKTDHSYNATVITGYFKSNPIINPTKMMNVDKVQTTKTDSPQGTLDCKLTIDGTALTFASLGGSTTDLLQKLPVTTKRQGRSLQYEFNTNASPAYKTTTKTGIDAVIIHGTLIEPMNVSI